MNNIILPDKNDMKKRLAYLKAGDRHFEEQFHSLIMKEAGEEKTSYGVVTMFVLIIETYIRDVNVGVRKTLYAQVPYYIESLIDNQKARESVLSIWREQ